MPETAARLRVLAVAPYVNGEGVGEGYSIFQWLAALSKVVDLTVLSVNAGGFDLASQLPSARVEVIAEAAAIRSLPSKLRRTAKPGLPIFFSKAVRWIKQEQASGVEWDVLHQVLPQAMRYAAPWHRLSIPYVIGPLGGGLSTPPGFSAEVEEGGLSALRRLDAWRLRNDPWLRQGYENAALVLGVGPYVEEALTGAGISLKRFRPELERAYEGTFPDVTRTGGIGEARLLHVGRGVRTKALRDVIRALALLSDLPGVRLTVAGEGPEHAICEAEAKTLGVADRVEFLGRVPRARVDELYAEADVFCFPSFREPMGGVFFEAMEFGLPIVAADRGGPAYILDETCSIQLPAENPDQFKSAIADAVRRLAMDPKLRRRLGAGSVARLRSLGSWNDKAETLVGLYREVLAA